MALILVVVGIAVTLLVGSIAGGIIGGWARKEGIVIDVVQANLVGPPTSRSICVLIQVRNIGSSPVTSLTARVEPVTVSWTVSPPATVNPGQTGTFSGCGAAGSINRGDPISVFVVGNVPGGNVGDRRNVPVT